MKAQASSLGQGFWWLENTWYTTNFTVKGQTLPLLHLLFNNFCAHQLFNILVDLTFKDINVKKCVSI
jgi:hypothetical protein